MLNDNAKKWVTALRSGEYEQARGALTLDGRYCCLGVACAISPIPAKEWLGRSLLPDEVRTWLGLSHEAGRYKRVYKAAHLTSDNDERKLTFSEIADIIESEPEGLFV